MASSVLDRLAELPRKNLGMKGESLSRRGEGLRKKFADPDAQRALGRLIERSLEIAGITKGQLARSLGYGDDQSQVARWIAGVERAQIERLLALPAFCAAFVVALAEQGVDGVEIETVVKVRRKARTA